MPNSAAQKVERVVGSFASVLSSALTLTDENGQEPLKDSSSVLPKFISPVVSNDDVCMIIPSLLLKHGETSTSSGGSLQDTAAMNLSNPIALATRELEAAPMAILANLCDSFTALIDSRLRSSIQALIRQSHSQKDSTLTRVLVGLLACAQSPITPSTVVTSFRAIPSCEVTPKGEIVMPVVLEAIIDLKIFGNLVSVTIVSPGTIQTTFANDFLLVRAELTLDTLALLQSMMKQARYAVRKAVATASSIATNLLMPSSVPETRSAMPNNVSSFSDLNHHFGMDPPSKSSFLMPPPPSRPSKRSLADLSASSSDFKNQYDRQCSSSAGKNNANWEEPSQSDARRRAIASGLSLLTAAAGMNRGKQEDEMDSHNKKQRREAFPRKVTSCPRFE